MSAPPPEDLARLDVAVGARPGELTDRQRSVLRFVSNYISANGASPSLREIAAAHGWNSPQSARQHVQALVKKGHLTRAAGLHRTMRVL